MLLMGRRRERKKRRRKRFVLYLSNAVLGVRAYLGYYPDGGQVSFPCETKTAMEAESVPHHARSWCSLRKCGGLDLD